MSDRAPGQRPSIPLRPQLVRVSSDSPHIHLKTRADLCTDRHGTASRVSRHSSSGTARAHLTLASGLWREEVGLRRAALTNRQTSQQVSRDGHDLGHRDRQLCYPSPQQRAYIQEGCAGQGAGRESSGPHPVPTSPLLSLDKLHTLFPSFRIVMRSGGIELMIAIGPELLHRHYPRLRQAFLGSTLHPGLLDRLG